MMKDHLLRRCKRRQRRTDRPRSAIVGRPVDDHDLALGKAGEHRSRADNCRHTFVLSFYQLARDRPVRGLADLRPHGGGTFADMTRRWTHATTDRADRHRGCRRIGSWAHSGWRLAYKPHCRFDGAPRGEGSERVGLTQSGRRRLARVDAAQDARRDWFDRKPVRAARCPAQSRRLCHPRSARGRKARAISSHLAALSS